MAIQLINPNAGFPGCDHEGKRCGWYYEDTHTGMKFEGGTTDLNHQCKAVADHRRANPRVYPLDQPLHFDLDVIRHQIIVQACSLHPELCEDSAVSVNPQPVPRLAPPAQPVGGSGRPNGRPCAKCGANGFEPVICYGCGAKVTGYKCTACGFIE